LADIVGTPDTWANNNKTVSNNQNNDRHWNQQGLPSMSANNVKWVSVTW